MKTKAVHSLGETVQLKFHSLLLRAQANSFPAALLSLGLTQAIHIQASVPGNCGLCHGYVRGAGGAGLSRAHTPTPPITYLPHGLVHAWRGGNPARAHWMQRGMRQTSPMLLS